MIKKAYSQDSISDSETCKPVNLIGLLWDWDKENGSQPSPK